MLQVHPDMDQNEWASSALLKLKPAGKPFPVNNDVSVLKWRATLADEDGLPIVCEYGSCAMGHSQCGGAKRVNCSQRVAAGGARRMSG